MLSHRIGIFCYVNLFAFTLDTKLLQMRTFKQPSVFVCKIDSRQWPRITNVKCLSFIMIMFFPNHENQYIEAIQLVGLPNLESILLNSEYLK